VVARRAPRRPMGSHARSGRRSWRHPMSASLADGWGTSKRMTWARRAAPQRLVTVEGGEWDVYGAVHDDASDAVGVMQRQKA
jgi:hypothetical protein